MHLLRARFLGTLLCSTAMLLNACGSWVVQTTPVATLVAEQEPGMIRVEAGEGRRRTLTRPQIVGDSIRGTERAAVAIAIADVTSVSTWKSDPGKTAALVGVGMLAALTVAAASFSMQSLSWRLAPR